MPADGWIQICPSFNRSIYEKFGAQSALGRLVKQIQILCHQAIRPNQVVDGQDQIPVQEGAIDEAALVGILQSKLRGYETELGIPDNTLTLRAVPLEKAGYRYIPGNGVVCTREYPIDRRTPSGGRERFTHSITVPGFSGTVEIPFSVVVEHHEIA